MSRNLTLRDVERMREEFRENNVPADVMLLRATPENAKLFTEVELGIPYKPNNDGFQEVAGLIIESYVM